MKKTKKRSKKGGVNYAKYGYLFIAPFFIVYLIFSFIPLIDTFYTSLFETTTRNLQTTSVFAGISNYLKVLGISAGEKGYFLTYLGNTLRLWLINFIPQIVLSLLVGAWMTDNRNRLRTSGLYKILVYMPNIITAASISILFCALLSQFGPIMSSLRSLGIIDSGFDIMKSKWGTGIAISLILCWMWYGNTALLLIAGMIGISPSIYESADIDGAGSWKKFTGITIPLLKPVLLYVLVTSLIGGLQLYDIPALFNTGQGTGYIGGPNDTSTTVAMYIMRLRSSDPGRASAVSVLLFIITVIASVLFFKVFNNDAGIKRLKAEGMKAKQKKLEDKAKKAEEASLSRNANLVGGSGLAKGAGLVGGSGLAGSVGISDKGGSARNLEKGVYQS